MSDMLCPTCKVALVMSERQTIEIDYCPQCRGVWLDRGELDKIIERSAAPVAPPPPQQQAAPPPPQNYAPRGGYDDYGHHGGYDKYGRKKRPKSFLEQIFD